MLQRNLLFSVIIPCYNSESYVKDSIESIIKQTYSNWELILINDGSEDNTLNILEKYADNDLRIKLYSKSNGGYATAINMGLDKISGDYFLMMGSDDCLANELFSEVAKNIEKNNPDMIAFRTIKVVDKCSKGIDEYTNFRNFVYVDNTSIKEFETDYPKEACIFSVRDTSKIYKTKLLGDLRYFGKYGFDADGIFSMMFSHKAHSFCCIPFDGYYWTLRSDSVSANTNLQVDLDRIRNWQCFYNSINNYDAIEITKSEKQYLVYYYDIICSVMKAPKEENIRKDVNNSLKTIIRAIKRYNATNLVFPKKRKKNTLFMKLPSVWYVYKRLQVKE